MSVRWTEKDVEAHFKKLGKTLADAPVKKSIKNTVPYAEPVEPKGLVHIKQVLQEKRINYVTEYQFSDGRLFRFDVIIYPLKIAIEYEGIYAKKSRHTNTSGYVIDCEKYNLATIEGWRMLRYTAKNYENFAGDVERLLESRKTVDGGVFQ